MRSKFFDPAPGDWARACTAQSARHLSFSDPTSQDIWRGGQILSLEDSMPRYDLVTRKPMYWPNSTEQMTSLVVVLDTLEQDSPEDDGIRRHYIPKARLFTDSGQPILHTAYRAFIEAMKEAGRSEQLPEIGGYLLVKWFDTELSRQNTVSRKLWIMRYRAPGVEV